MESQGWRPTAKVSAVEQEVYVEEKTTYHAQKGVPDLSVTTPIQAQF